VLYYFEPMHPVNDGDADLTNWFQYARPGQENSVLAKAFDPLFAGLPSPARAWNRAGWHRWVPGYRVVVKDVAAFMAAEWLYERYRPHMLFVVRHPCAVILSEARQGTPAQESLRTILSDEALVEDHLKDYIADLTEAQGQLETLAAVWAARHRVLANGLKKHPEWQVIHYEALCANPGLHFRRVFESVGLRWSSAMADFVDDHSRLEIAGRYSGRRVSARQIDRWKAELDVAEEERVRQICQALEIPFYAAEEEWSLKPFLEERDLVADRRSRSAAREMRAVGE
jgi:hypothetical protein